ncbi:hypothetical protein ACS0TY_021371 [Phlomoides rotata]
MSVTEYSWKTNVQWALEFLNLIDERLKTSDLMVGFKVAYGSYQRQNIEEDLKKWMQIISKTISGITFLTHYITDASIENP